MCCLYNTIQLLCVPTEHEVKFRHKSVAYKINGTKLCWNCPRQGELWQKNQHISRECFNLNKIFHACPIAMNLFHKCWDMKKQRNRRKVRGRPGVLGELRQRVSWTLTGRHSHCICKLMSITSSYIGWLEECQTVLWSDLYKWYTIFTTIGLRSLKRPRTS